MASPWINVVEPVANLIDDLFTSDEEKLLATNELAKIESVINTEVIGLQRQVLELKSVVVKQQASIITAESQGHSWLQRSWRPLTMLTFLFLIICDSFGLLEFRLSEQAWELLKLGLGGYVVGRSVEKAIPGVGQVLDKLKTKGAGDGQV
ncbi:hypothetical protein EXT46_05370 [Pseudoalteromonas sp. CO325X]|uniref:3TM-type holin n=1 Tax=Pseudoalteromonas sp. CO325X TaxID=1777262 RepID=UPI001023E967|nr:3TM-type holin [Pseudoalteromonas sp. CO325X]RZF83724.1 hypothetical protein EXT46_05370 [Pseudoalteromonas sp. CO325X]